MAGIANDLNINQLGIQSFNNINGVFTGVTITGGVGITVTNGNGQTGNPIISLTGGGAAVEHLTGNTGGQLNPDGSNNFNLLGTGSFTTSGLGSTITGTLTGLTNHAVLVGAGTGTITNVGPTATAGQVLQSNGLLADPSFSTATYPSTTTINQVLYSSAANTVTGLATANNGILITSAAGVPSILAAGTTGQVLTATTGSPPSWASPATSGTVTTVSVVSANGFAGTVANATTTPAITLSTTITGVLSGNGTAITGSAVTQYDVLVGGAANAISSVGPGTAGQVLQSGGNAANPAYSTATYPSTTTINQILYSSAANVVSGLATANSATLVTTSAGVPVMSATMTNGQVIIGSTGATPAAGTITSTGGTLTVTTGAGTLNLEVAGSGFTWSDTSGAFAAVKENGYFITTTATGTLPAVPAEGDTIKFIVDTTNLLTIQANTGQKIRIGTTLSAAAGTAVNTQRGDAIELVYRTVGTTWFSQQNPVGGWNIT